MKLKQITVFLLAVLLLINVSPLVFAADLTPEPELTVEKLTGQAEEAAAPLSEADVAAARLKTYEQFLGYYYLTFSPLEFLHG